MVRERENETLEDTDDDDVDEPLRDVDALKEADDVLVLVLVLVEVVVPVAELLNDADPDREDVMLTDWVDDGDAPSDKVLVGVTVIVAD